MKDLYCPYPEVGMAQQYDSIQNSVPNRIVQDPCTRTYYVEGQYNPHIAEMQKQKEQQEKKDKLDRIISHFYTQR